MRADDVRTSMSGNPSIRAQPFAKSFRGIAYAAAPTRLQPASTAPTSQTFATEITANSAQASHRTAR
ncbi:hypothetical protein, partial [Rhizobium ruizarguesonis]|uniref:hypothetical protein n=1 Tax=Rhizobium ruizarguesonis TaxID=2081791 RepID=UPI001953B2A0